MVNRISYEHLVVTEKGQWELSTGELIKLGVCGFCGHLSKNGYIIKSKDGRLMEVGTNCVFVLCNLTKHQQKAIKHLAAIQKNKEKHLDIIQQIKGSHEFISLAFDNFWVDENGKELVSVYHLGFRDGTKRMAEAKETLLCKTHPKGRHNSESNCAACIGATILYKANNTTKVHPFWIDRYHKLIGGTR